MTGKPQIVSVGLAVEKDQAFPVEVDFRARFAAQHLQGAERFSHEVKELSQQSGASGALWTDILHTSTACVFMTVASLEAYINELFADRATIFAAHDKDDLAELWRRKHYKPTIEKFNIALELLGQAPLQDTSPPCNDIAVLIRLRNALMHFKPEWESRADDHQDISTLLTGRFEPAFLPEDRLLFPRRWACHGCTSWAIRSVWTFIRHFEKLAGIRPRIAG